MTLYILVQFARRELIGEIHDLNQLTLLTAGLSLLFGGINHILMMGLSSEDHYKQGLLQIATSEIVEEERKRCACHPFKTLTTSLITCLPDDCLNLIFWWSLVAFM